MGIFDRFKKDIAEQVVKSVTDWGPFFPSAIWQDPGYASSDVLADYSKVGNPMETNSTVYSCVDRISSNISQVPFSIIDEKTDEAVDVSHPLYRLFAYPAVNWNQYILFDSIVKNLETQGKAYLISEQYRKSPIGTIPSVIWVANSQYMKPIIENGEIKEFQYGEGQKTATFQPAQVTFIRYWHPNNPWDGLAPLSAARLGVMLQWYSNQYNTRQFKDGPMVSGFWKPDGPRPLTPANEKELNDLMKQKAGKGYQNAGKAPVLQGVTFQPVGISQKDLQFVEMMKMTKEDILEVFRVPKSLLGLTDTTFANANEAKKAFWSSKLIPIMKMVEQFLYVGFFKRLNQPYYLQFNYASIPELQEDMLAKVQVAEKLYNMGVPFALINEKLEFGFESFPGAEVSNPKVPGAPAFSEDQIYEKISKKKKIEKMAQMPFDHALRIGEQNKAAKVMVQYEKLIEAKLKRFWKEQYTLVINELKDNSKSVDKAALDTIRTALINFLNRLKFGEGFFNASSDLLSKAYIDGIKRVYSGVGIKPPVLIHDAEMHLAMRGVKIKDSANEIMTALSQSIRDADTVDNLAKKISDVFDSAETRAKLIARTESTAAYNGGRVRGIERLGIKKKQWVNSGDDKVRESHRIDQTVDVNEPFTLNSGVKVQYPGEGPASESCNCRCSVIPVILEEDVNRLNQ